MVTSLEAGEAEVPENADGDFERILRSHRLLIELEDQGEAIGSRSLSLYSSTT